MAKKASFAFGDDDTLDDNLNAFHRLLAEDDAVLADALKSYWPELLQTEFSNGEIWDSLYSAATLPQPSTHAAVAPVLVTPSPSASVTGWLLEGVSIEGFRGINNEGKPLELKFYPDKVNSLSAVNGTGKSSVYDAVRYAICGKLQWLDDLPSAERTSDYYLNKFNGTGKASISLKLIGEPNGDRVVITIERDRQGTRTVSCNPTAADANAILRTLDREFILLDGRTFQTFISADPLHRGRTFSGLLGVARYNSLRQSLAAIANTRAFNNHFAVAIHSQNRVREEKVFTDTQALITADYLALVGIPVGTLEVGEAQQNAHAALAQVALLKTHCDGHAFLEIDVDACIESVKEAEGSPKRDRLAQAIRSRAELTTLRTGLPDSVQAASLIERATAREAALAETVGDVMLGLYRSGRLALDLPGWGDPNVCPLCEQKTPHDLRAHVDAKLGQFDALDVATKELASEWATAGWEQLVGLEAKLETVPENRLISAMRGSGARGELSLLQAATLTAWLRTLHDRANALDAELASEQTELESELPPSSVELTRKVEAARRLQTNWKRLSDARIGADAEKQRELIVSRIKNFLDEASNTFAVAESALSKARLTAVEPIFKDYFKKLSFFGVIPSVNKPDNSEQLQLGLSDFYGLTNVSPTALLSESFRNAFAISLYLAAASKYGGMPKFVILDDVTSSFDAGHQNFLVELIRTTFARPANPAGLQVILLSHDTMLEKLFNKHGNTATWSHQRLEGTPQVAVLPQSGAVNKVKDQTVTMLQAGQIDSAKEGVRQYLEYRLSDLIGRLRIPVPVDVAFNDNKQLSNEFLQAINAAVDLHQHAGDLVLTSDQVSGLNVSIATIVGNFLSHWGTGQTLSYSAPALLGVMQSIDDYCDCFKYQPTQGAPLQFYKSLHQRA